MIPDEAVTLAGTDPEDTRFLIADRYLPCGNWNGKPPKPLGVAT
jgi:hypothetical protein